MRKYFQLGDEEIYLTVGKYYFGGNLLVKAICRNGEPFANITVNFDTKLENIDLAYLNINLYGIDIEKFISDNGLGTKVEGRERRSGYLIYPLYRFNLENL